eukprot:3135663-Amphidinium_carterae.1
MRTYKQGATGPTAIFVLVQHAMCAKGRKKTIGIDDCTVVSSVTMCGCAGTMLSFRLASRQ